MIELKSGEVYTVARTRQGESAKGPWQFVAVKELIKKQDGSLAEGRKEVTVWVDNKPQPISEGGKFRLGIISSVKFASRKDNTGTWRDELNVNASIEPVMDGSAASSLGIDVPGFTPLDDSENLPF